ncbi:MAG: hypothetical protein AAGF71_08160 [Pseudomonadota bacterium]
MPHLIRVYIRQVIAGFVLSACFVAALLYINVANLWHLVTHVDVGWIAVLMLWVFNGIVFAGVQFALALPSGKDDDDTGGKRDAIPTFLAEPVPVRVDRNR